jgi:PAS domain S-box-containing protein
VKTSLKALKRALDNDELAPFFQPLVELRTGIVVGFEVLARASHPKLGMHLPSNLIGLAERNGLIDTLTWQVLGKALREAAAISGKLQLAVNLSPNQLQNPTLARQFADLAEATNFPLDRLTIEITETALMKDVARARSAAHSLKELGCRLSLDDFGTGCSSMAHLQSLPFSELKIDRSFVTPMTRRRDSRKIVAAIIGLGKSLGLSTIAEGIETEEHADMLLWLGSDLGQGWFYGRPSSVEQAREVALRAPCPAAHGLSKPGKDWAVNSLEALPTQRLAQLQAIYDGAPVGLCFLDRELRYVSLNQRLASMNGASIAEHLGKSVQEMVPGVHEQAEVPLKRALAGESMTGVEIVRPAMAGSPNRALATKAWLVCSYQPAFDEADEVIGVSVSVMDVTERRRTEEALEQMQVVEQTVSALHGQQTWTLDASGDELLRSADWARTYVAGGESKLDLGWLEALHEEDLKPTIRKMKKALRTGKHIDVEYRVVGEDGTWRWMRSRGLPRLDPDGEVTRWYGSVVDIHDEKTAKAELRATKARMRALLRTIPVAIMSEASGDRVLAIEAAPEADHGHADIPAQSKQSNRTRRRAKKGD